MQVPNIYKGIDFKRWDSCLGEAHMEYKNFRVSANHNIHDSQFNASTWLGVQYSTQQYFGECLRRCFSIVFKLELVDPVK